MLSGEATHTNYIVFSLTQSGIEPTIYRTRGEHASHYATDDRGLLPTRKLLNQGFLLVKLKSSFRKFYGRNHDWVDRYEISVTQMITDMLHYPVLSSFLAYRRFLTRVTRWVTLVGQELLINLEHLRSASSPTPFPSVLSRARVTRSLAICVCFVDRWLPLWYLQTFLNGEGNKKGQPNVEKCLV